MYILHQLNHNNFTTMRVISTLSFKSAKAVVYHLTSLAQLSSRVDNSSLPLSDLQVYLPSIKPYLLYLKKGWHKNLYFGFRRHGFEFETFLSFFTGRISLFHDVLATYTLTFDNGHYILALVEL